MPMCTHLVTIRAVDPKSEHTGELTYEFDAKKFGPKCDPEQPPPFDTKGRTRRVAMTRAAPKNLRLQVEAKAKVKTATEADSSTAASDDVDLDYGDVDYGKLE